MNLLENLNLEKSSNTKIIAFVGELLTIPADIWNGVKETNYSCPCSPADKIEELLKVDEFADYSRGSKLIEMRRKYGFHHESIGDYVLIAEVPYWWNHSLHGLKVLGTNYKIKKINRRNDGNFSTIEIEIEL
jgi:hypothetical protein